MLVARNPLPLSADTNEIRKIRRSQPCGPLRVCQLCFQGGRARNSSYILSTSVLHKFLDEKAAKTPFLFEYLQHLRKKMNSFFVCGNCDSWIRRQNNCYGRGGAPTGKVLLSVDRLILSIMLPGSYAPPEMRITQRLVHTLRMHGGNNWMSTICPPLVVRVLLDNDILLQSRKVLKSITVATWRSGRRQVVLGNAVFAKNVRCAQHIL
jgi:hypothetical protein